ncbi:MAG: TraR/DksA C4-type zinc finger protein [Zetaproteobacteria bacterium]|nr:TraR/DksA C4-type zinc finger protein [Zetaproteobacteria bacterium]
MTDNNNQVKKFPASDIFSQEELSEFWDRLVSEKSKLLAHAKEAVQKGSIRLDANEMMDEVDLASATIEQNLTFRLLDRERKLLSSVERALGKIKTGDYGYCEGTGEPIPKKRLQLTPWTRHSVKHKEHLERMKKSGRSYGDNDQHS